MKAPLKETRTTIFSQSERAQHKLATGVLAGKDTAGEPVGCGSTSATGAAMLVDRDVQLVQVRGTKIAPRGYGGRENSPRPFN